MIAAMLVRSETGDQGTFGRLFVGDASFFTGELAWRDNRPNESCFPGGRYRGIWGWSERFRRKMYALVPVAGRAGIRLHSANFMGVNPPWRKQLNGCVALGEKLGWIEGQKALLLSAPAVRRFESMLAGQPFELEVRWS